MSERFYEESGAVDEEVWSTASPARRWGLVAAAASAVVVLLGLCGFGLVLAKGEDQDTTRPAAADHASTTPQATSAPPPPAETPTATPTSTGPTASRSATRPANPKVTPAKNPKATLPPPPAPPKTSAPGCVPATTGPAAPAAEVRAALQTAAGHTYWRSVPTIKVPERLLIAIAMTESSWRSNVVACDGGIGLMQVMPGTVTQINNRFGTTWDVRTLQGNVHLGANYLAWSTRYFGDTYFAGSYDLADPALLDAVIAGYNYGAGAVDPTRGAAGIPNPRYVSTVKGYLAACPCDAW